MTTNTTTNWRAAASGRRAFTLVEILVVVVILGIISAIVVPQFTTATTDAYAGNIKAQLATINNQIELYRSQNRGALPTFGTTGWTQLLDGDYMKSAPSNPAHADQSKRTLIVVKTSAGQHGDAAAGWVWNSADQEMYASYYDEATEAVTLGTP
jgi:prepilin-type N-terminal cleavage/methylation domain-containing protein